VGVAVLAGSKCDLAERGRELLRREGAVLLVCGEGLGLECSRELRAESLWEVPSALAGVGGVSVLVADLFDEVRHVRASYGGLLARRALDRVMRALRAFSEARGVEVYVLLPATAAPASSSRGPEASRDRLL